MASRDAPDAEEDSVLRRERFEREHPDINITLARGLWYAHRDARRLAGPCYWLNKLLDCIEGQDAR